MDNSVLLLVIQSASAHSAGPSLLACWFVGLLVCWLDDLMACWLVGLLASWFVGRWFVGSLGRIIDRFGSLGAKWHPNRSQIDQKIIKIEAWRHLGRHWGARSASKSIKMEPLGRWGSILGDFGAPGRSREGFTQKAASRKYRFFAEFC